VGTPNGSQQLELASGGLLTRLVDSQAVVQLTWTLLLIPQCVDRTLKMLHAVFDLIYVRCYLVPVL